MQELEKLIRVSLALPIIDNDLFLIRREKPPFKGLLGLPGGKVERTDYDYYDALRREMLEELGTFVAPTYSGGILYEAIVSEKKKEYFAMHIFVMHLKEEPSGNGIERIPILELANMENEIIPSDYIIINNIMRGKRNNVYQAVTVSINNSNFVTEWNDITHLEYRL
jgi:8-oxo-dGTP pyrophosphatase MutT (NUDIX family)